MHEGWLHGWGSVPLLVHKTELKNAGSSTRIVIVFAVA